MKIYLDDEAKAAIEAALCRGKDAEIGIRNGKIVIWETSSKKKYEAVITSR